MKVQLRDQLGDLARALGEQRQHAAHEPLLKIPHTRPPNRDRTAAQRQPPRLAVAVAVTGLSIHRRSPR
jgi:hypothetical protein